MFFPAFVPSDPFQAWCEDCPGNVRQQRQRIVLDYAWNWSYPCTRDSRRVMLAMVTRGRKAELSRAAVLTRKTDAWPPRSTPKLFTHQQMRKAFHGLLTWKAYESGFPSACQPSRTIQNDGLRWYLSVSIAAVSRCCVSDLF